MTPAAAFRRLGGAVSGGATRPAGSPLAEFKAAARATRKAAKVYRQAVAQADERARQDRPAPARPVGALFDGKEIQDAGGRVVGRWRYRGGAFVPDYFNP